MVVKYKVNYKEMNTDGDWIQCPECEEVAFPLLSWMTYCPMCCTELDFQGCVLHAIEETEVKNG